MSLDKDEIINDELLGGNKEIISKKPLESLSKSITDAINLITVDKNEFIRFGSFFSSAILYPSDIDIMEIIEVCCNKEKAIDLMVKELQRIVKEIKKKKGYYYSELKCGLDDAYNLDIGLIKEGIVVGYDKKKIEKEIKRLIKENYFEKEDIKKLLEILNEEMDTKINEELYVILRKYFILRWTKEEVIKGVKKIRGNRLITLKEACSHKTMIKMDIWAPINAKYIEVTNFYVLAYKEDNEVKLVNFDEDFLNMFTEGIKKEISKLNYSNYYFNPLKMLKRMWSLAKFTKDYGILDTLTPFLRSEVGLLGQIKSELETVILIIKKIIKPPMKKLIEQIDNLRNRLAYVIEVDIDEKLIDETIKKLIKSYKRMKKETIIKTLESIKEYVSTIINKYSIEFIKKNRYPPKNYLPNEIVLSGGKIDFLNPFKRGYQLLENQYRKKNCNGKSRPLEYGELHPLCANYEGPGTRIDLYPNYPPYNKVDNAARTHDLMYSNSKGNPEKIREADEEFIKNIEGFSNEEPYYSLGKIGIEGKIKSEDILPYLTKLISGPNYFGKKK
jgi:hypothetical protein